jgi:ankyrin repeat protein
MGDAFRPVCQENVDEQHHLHRWFGRHRLGHSRLLGAAVEFPEITRLLVESGAPIEAPCSKGRWRALHIAVSYGHAETAKVLLDAGADVNAKASADFTPLHVAAWCNRLGAATA